LGPPSTAAPDLALAADEPSAEDSALVRLVSKTRWGRTWHT